MTGWISLELSDRYEGRVDIPGGTGIPGKLPISRKEEIRYYVPDSLFPGMNVDTKYLKMIKGMKRNGRKEWGVYILRCGDGSLYTGIAKDVQARLKQHREGRGAAYTRTRLPVTLLYKQEGWTHSEALIREAQIKAMPRSKKEEMISLKHSS